MDNDQAKKLFSKAIRYAFKRKLRREDAEDFAQWFVMEALKPGRSLYTGTALIDYSRLQKWTQRKEAKGYRTTYMNYLKSLDPKFTNVNGELESILDFVEDGNVMNQVDAVDLEVVLKDLSIIDRGILILYEKWGLTMGEIGHIFGVSETSVLMWLREIKAQIEKAHPNAVWPKRTANS